MQQRRCCRYKHGKVTLQEGLQLLKDERFERRGRPAKTTEVVAAPRSRRLLPGREPEEREDPKALQDLLEVWQVRWWKRLPWCKVPLHQ